MSDESLQYDILVVGGGMVGAAVAAACAGKGWRIALVESREPARDWPAGDIDLRVSAISRASQRVLRRLGVWGRIETLGASPYREMRVWDAVGGGAIHFDSADIGEPDLGHIVENRAIQLALWERLTAAPDVTLVCPALPEDLWIGPLGAELTLADGLRITAGLLVAADGRDSWVRGRLGIESRGFAYDQQAIVANVEVAGGHQETAWQRFLPTGPVALLPLADGRCSIVWSATDARAAELLALDDECFRHALGDAIEHRLGAIGAIGPRAAFPLRLEHAVRYVEPHVALVGDAAHSIHPLAGQGVNLGFLDAAELADALDQARGRGRDIGGMWTLRRYERARRGENLMMMAAMDAFKRLFGNENSVVAAVRGAGLAMTDRLGPVKALFMRQAMGLSDGLPPLARP